MGILDEIFQNCPTDTKVNSDASLKERCSTDLELFARSYFPHYFSNTWSQFHYNMVNRLEDITLNKQDDENKLVVAAPRGHAKSTIFTFLKIMWDICYERSKVIVVISATNGIAKKFIIGCRIELETNELLMKDFGKLQGDILWSASEFCTSNNVYVCGKGAGEQMRGLRWQSNRPDCVLIDDLESKESVATQGQRENLEDWFTGDVMPMGMPNCNFLYVGTILSYESLLYKLLHEARYSSWEREIYSAVIKDSTSPLWEQWETMVLDLSRGNKSMSDGKKFYEENKEEMLKDVELLWESQRKNMYLFLRIKKIENEEKYNSEYQNNPMTENLREFKEQWLINNTYESIPEITEVYGALDPSLGKNKNSDTSAIIMLGRGVDNYFYVLEADVKRRKPDDIIKDMQQHIMKYYGKLKGFVVETNVWQDYFASNIKDQFLAMGFHVNWIEQSPIAGDKKELRIKSMAPKVKHGYIKFNKTHITLWNQLKNFPKGHDDAPDALQMALEQMLLSTSSKFSFVSLPSQKNTPQQQHTNIFQRLLGNRR